MADRRSCAGEHEVLLRGDRVLLGGDAGILAPFDDDFRYGAKAGGYHGGATPEEVLVPVAVFIPAGIDPPAGWEELQPRCRPLWWDLRIPPADGASVAIDGRAPPKPAKPVDESQGAMFDVGRCRAGTVTSGRHGAGLDRCAPGQRRSGSCRRGAASRAQLPDDRVRAVAGSPLTAEAASAPSPPCAADTGMPASRLPGFLANLARVLNVDGYAVLDVDATGHRGAPRRCRCSRQQFEIAGGR